MSTRKILLSDCETCPSRDHKGAFGIIGHIPVCRAVNKEMPFTLGAQAGGRVQAIRTLGIPDWCPLPLDVEPTSIRTAPEDGAEVDARLEP
jgi:hypothetical protein